MAQEQKKITRERQKLLRKRLNEQLGTHRQDVQKAAVLSWLQFVMRIITFWYIAQLVFQLYQGQTVDLASFFMVVGGLSLVGYVLAILAKKYQGRASQYARNRLKQQFFDTFTKNSGELDKSLSTADVLTVASQGIDMLDTYYGHYLSLRYRACFNCMSVAAIVAFLFPLGGIIFIVSLPLIPISIILMQKRSKKIMQHYWATYMDVGNLFMDDLQGLNTLYAYQADGLYETTFVQKAEAFRHATMDLLRFQLQSVGYMDAVMYFGIGVAGFFALQALAAGELTLFSLVFFMFIASEFFAPIRELGYGMHLLMMNTKMADRIFVFLDSVDTSTDNQVAEKTVAVVDKIVFEQVQLNYGDTMIVAPLSMTLRKGQFFAVAGESGVGKTTLAKALCKQLPLHSGRILLNEDSLQELTRADVMQQLVYISPDSYLFNQTILENLQMGTDLSVSEIEAFMAQENVLSFVAQLPEGLYTRVGENGQLLSPGQRQQIICVRAMLAKKSVYIVDEMTSSVDIDNEQIIFDLIKRLAKEAIVIFISHKMKQVMCADEVLFLHQEGLAIGQPDDLYANNAIYRHLADTQAELEAILHD